MARHKERETASIEVHEESLVPMIEAEERRLEELLDRTRNEADGIVREAERAAGEELARVKERLPALEEERRQRAQSAFESEARALGEQTASAAGELKAAAASLVSAAVMKVVESVWPAAR